MVKFSKFCSKAFTASLIDVVVFKCRRIVGREIGEMVGLAKGMVAYVAS